MAAGGRGLSAAPALLALLLFLACPARAGEPVPVWIDTDPACGGGPTDDVDDCWALMLAFKSPEIAVRGVSTVFGNVDGGTAHHTGQAFLNDLLGAEAPPVHRGAGTRRTRGGDKGTAATAAMARALEQGPLTVIALGPLTNVAALFKHHPRQVNNIRAVIAVAGMRPEDGLGFHPGNTRILHFHDLNFRKDPEAFEVVLRSAVPVTLLPFEAATRVILLPGDLAALESTGGHGARLARDSRGWMTFWRERLGADGFHPFDSLVLGRVIRPGWFHCPTTHARIHKRRARFVESRHRLEVSDGFTDAPRVRYCTTVAPGFKPFLLQRLGS